jgi:ribonuclease J
MIRSMLSERGLDDGVVIRTFKPGSPFKVGPFVVEPVHVNHSIPHTCALAIRTSAGLLVHTADFKLDATPLGEPPADLARLAALGDEGVLALFSDSTNSERPGFAGSERVAREGLRRAISRADRAVFVGLFSTNLFRIQSLVDIAEELGRSVTVAGRSLEKAIGIARELGILKLGRDDLFVPLDQARRLPRERLLCLCSGSQGEARASMSKLATGELKWLDVEPGDLVLFSSRVIPGNERAVSAIRNELARRGARFLDDESSIHVSGHACQAEQAWMIRLLRPAIFVPVHGEHRFLRRHAELARSLGVDETHVLDNGDILEITPDRARVVGHLPARQIVVEGTAIGELGGEVLRDRRRLARRGLCTVFLAVDRDSRSIVEGPHVSALGVAEGSHEVFLLARQAAVDAFSGLGPNARLLHPEVAETLRRAVMSVFKRELERKPLIEVLVYYQ